MKEVETTIAENGNRRNNEVRKKLTLKLTDIS